MNDLNKIGTSILEYIMDAVMSVAGTCLDILNVGLGIINSILQMIPFSNIIANVINSFIAGILPFGSKGDESKKQCGIAPENIRAVLANGTYNAAAFKDTGNIAAIEKQGAGNVKSTSFINVGQGNTPPIHGRDGGPNSGATDPSDQQIPSFDKSTNPSLAGNRTLKLTLPDINPQIYQIDDEQKSQTNLIQIASMLDGCGLPTLESQATFLAICFANCRLIPKIADYDFPSVEKLKSAFPETFTNTPTNVISDYINSQTRKTRTAEQFYTYVYSSSADGKTFGNVNHDDGWKFAPAGMIWVCGRKIYEMLQRNLPRYKNSLQSATALIADLEASTAASAAMFKLMMVGVPASSTSMIYEALNRFPSVDRDLAIIAYQHFYGAPVFDSANPNLNTAGDTVDRNTVAGSANTKQPSQVGYQNVKYPLNPNTPSISKLATGDFTNTIVAQKEATRRIGLPYPNNSKTWSQPHSPYRAKYPFNDVKEYECGHVVEFDNTPNHERIHFWHRKGTFFEIDENGTKVTRIVGDNYELIDRNGFICINGDATVNVSGNINIVCQSNANIEVAGDTNLDTHGNFSVHAGKNINLCAGGGLHLWANQDVSLQGKHNVNIMSTENSIYINADDDIGLLSNTGSSYVSAKKGSVFISGHKSVDVYSDDGNCSVVGHDSAYLTGETGSVSVKGETCAAVSGGTDVDINAGANLRTQSLLSMTHMCPGWYRETYGKVNSTIVAQYAQTIGGAYNLSVVGLSGISVGGAWSISAGATAAIQAGADVQVTSGAKVGIKAAATVGIAGGGNVGIDGSVVGLNSGMAAASISPPSIPAMPELLPAGIACKAASGKSAPYSIPAVIYGIPAISTKCVVRNTIEPYPSTSPYELLPETDAELQSTDVKIVSNQLNAEQGIKTPVAVTTFETPAEPTVSPAKTPKSPWNQLVMNTDPKTFDNNTQISDWFRLGDLIDEGVRGKNALRPQVGLSINQIVSNMSQLCTNIVEPMLQWLPGGFSGFKKQWYINSGFRSLSNPETSDISQHNKGMAVDIQIPNYSAKQLQALLTQICTNLDYDQCILEHTTKGNMIIHVSYDPQKNKQRHKKLTMDYRLEPKVIGRDKFVFYSV